MKTLFENETGLTTEPIMKSTALVEHRTPDIEPTPMMLIQHELEAGRDPGKLMDLAERWEKNRAAEAFGIAVTDFQCKMPVVFKGRKTKDSGAFGYSFASFDDIMRAASPILKQCGLALSFSSDQVDGQLKITCRVRHGIHYEDSTLTVPVPQMKVNETQKYGAALSYAKRYALCAALNIVVSDEDSDGEGLVTAITDEQLVTLNEWIETTNTDLPRFLKWLAIEKLSDMSVEQFNTAIYELRRKGKR